MVKTLIYLEGQGQSETAWKRFPHFAGESGGCKGKESSIWSVPGGAILAISIFEVWHVFLKDSSVRRSSSDEITFTHYRDLEKLETSKICWDMNSVSALYQLVFRSFLAITRYAIFSMFFQVLNTFRVENQFHSTHFLWCLRGNPWKVANLGSRSPSYSTIINSWRSWMNFALPHMMPARQARGRSRVNWQVENPKKNWCFGSNVTFPCIEVGCGKSSRSWFFFLIECFFWVPKQYQIWLPTSLFIYSFR